jgi:DNA gyrase subunit A
MITQKGEIKRTPLSAFSNLRNNGLIAFDIEEGDTLGWALKTRGNDDVILITRRGMSIRFSETEATSRSRAAGGVKAMSLREEDYIVSADVANDQSYLLVASELGFGKLTTMDSYHRQGRGGLGVKTMDITAKTGLVVGAEVVEDDDRLIVMTTGGKAIRMKVKDIRVTGRVAQGVSLIKLAANDQVRSIARLVMGADDGDLEAEEATTE